MKQLYFPQFNIVRKNHSRLKDKLLSVMLCVMMFAGICQPALTVIAAEQNNTQPQVYPIPDKILPIDATDAYNNNYEWYIGTTTDNDGNTVFSSRYDVAPYNTTYTVDNIKQNLGTAQCPYIIETGLELSYLANIVNGTAAENATGVYGVVDDFTGKSIRLVGSKRDNTISTNCIDLISACGVFYQASADTIGWLPCNNYGDNKYGWTPIGTTVLTKDQNNAITGRTVRTFNGEIYADDGVKIYNMAANIHWGYDNDNTTKRYLNETDNYVFGLFGYVGQDAVIRNIDLVDVQIFCQDTDQSYIGTIAGNVAAGATIYNCSANGYYNGENTYTSNPQSMIETEASTGLLKRSLSAGGNELSTTRIVDGNTVTGTEKYYYVPDFTVLTKTLKAYNIGEPDTISWYQTEDFIYYESEYTKLGNSSNKTPEAVVGGIVGTVSSVSYTPLGGVAHPTYSYDYINKISDVSLNHMNISCESGSGIGGVVGVIESPAASVVINGVSGSVNIISSKNMQTYDKYKNDLGYIYHVGGIVGYINSPSNSIIISGIGTSENVFDVSIIGNVCADDGSIDPDVILGGFGGIVGVCKSFVNLQIGKNNTAGNTDGEPCYVSVNAEISKAYIYIKKIANNTIVNIHGTNNNFYFGGVIGRILGTQDSSSVLSIENCTVKDSKFIRNKNNVDRSRIVQGGILGASNYYIANSRIDNCTVDNFNISTDGLFGFIVGIFATTQSCNINTISNCTVRNSNTYTATSLYTNSKYDFDKAKTSYSILGGIAASVSNANVNITGCSVIGISFNLMFCETVASSNIVGGIIGGVKGASSTSKSNISNCSTDVVFNIGTFGNVSGVFVGGIAGYAQNVNITGCASVVDYNMPKYLNDDDPLYSANLNIRYKYLNPIDYSVGLSNETYILAAKNNPTRDGAVVGGLVGLSDADVSISGSYTTGDINVDRSNSAENLGRPSTVGGLVGVVRNASTYTECFSTISLSGNLQDAVGGLFGLINPNIIATVGDCCFAGTLLNPYAASIAGCSGSISVPANKSIYVNRRFSPNSAAMNTQIEVTDTSTLNPSLLTNSIPNVILSNINTTSNFYKAAVTPLFTFGQNDKHVFAVADFNSVSIGFTLEPQNPDTYVIAEKTDTTYGILVSRRVKLIKNIIDTQYINDGLYSAYSIASDADLHNLQTYVSVGGGFLGATFNLTADITTDIAKPIGNADSDHKCSPEDSQPFCATFNGGSNTVTLTASRTNADSSMHNGLFGYIRDSSVSDLTVDFNGTISYSGTYAGGVVAYAAYSDINNVNVTAYDGLTLNATSSGGIVGCALNTVIDNVTDSHSSFTGNLTGSNNVGGIIGTATNAKKSYSVSTIGKEVLSNLDKEIILQYDSHSTTMQRCYVAGNITGSVMNGEKNTAVYTGGLVGYSNGGSLLANDSFILGNVSGASYVGGLAGYCGSDTATMFTNCYVKGDIYASDFAGGIIGYINNPNLVVNSIDCGYFVGQIYCDGALGALTSSDAVYTNFSYDKQVAGLLPVTGQTADDSDTAGQTTTGVNTAILGSVVTSTVVDYTTHTNDSTITLYTGSTSTYAGLTESSHTTSANDPGSWTGWHYRTSDGRYTYKFSSTSTTNKKTVKIDFRGQYFVLNDYVSSVSIKQKLFIDCGDVNGLDGVSYIEANSGTPVDNIESSLTAAGFDNLPASFSTYKSNFSWRKYTLNGKYEVYYAIQKGSTPNSSYSTYPVFANPSSPADVRKNQTLFIKFLDYDYNDPYSDSNSHTVVFDAVQDKDHYFSFFGYSIGVPHYEVFYNDSSFEIDSVDTTHYPQLKSFNGMDISEISTRYAFDFTDVTTNTANTFSAGNSITVRDFVGDTYTTDKNSSQLSAIGVQINNDNNREYDNVSISNRDFAGGKYKYTYTYKLSDNFSIPIEERIIVVPFEGDGTSDVPYSIRNVFELDLFRNYINNIYSGAGQHFRLDMTTSTDAHSADGNTYDLSGTDQLDKNNFGLAIADWSSDYPIGTDSIPFQGVFDGNGKTISNFKVTNLSADSNNNSYYAGLFGFTSGAVIKGLTILSNTTDPAVSITSSYNKPVYFGSIVAVAENTFINNCYVKTTVSVTNNSSNSSSEFNIGGAVGLASGFITISGVFSDNSNFVASGYNLNGIGNIVGAVNGKYNNAVVNIFDNVSYTKINCTSVNSISNVGGIAGKVFARTENSTSPVNVTVLVKNNAVYGNIASDYGMTGGIIGCSTPSGVWNLNIQNNICSADINFGVTGDTGVRNVGGIIGYSNASAQNWTLINNRYTGIINTVGKSSGENNIGGIIGKCSNSTSTLSHSNIFDSDNNSDLLCCGISIKDATYGQSAFTQINALSADGAYYISPVSRLPDTNFGSDDNLSLVTDTVDKAGLVAVNIVRTDISGAGQDDNGETDEYISLSSVFTHSTASTRLQIVDTDSTAYCVTANNKRFVSTDNDNTNAITVRVVSTDADVDFGSYAKTVTYYPSIKSLGKVDTSFIAANPSGDNISVVSGVNFSIYTEDQLMGLYNLVRYSTTADGYGNNVYISVDSDSDYSVYQKRDLNFSNLDYVAEKDVNLSNAMPIASSTYPFTGDYNGNQHTIAGIKIRGTDNASLFGYLDGAVITELGITDSVFTVSGATAKAASFASEAVNTQFSKCFSSARIEESNSTPAGIYLGGMVGALNAGAFYNCFFTGSVGVVKKGTTYPAASTFIGNGDYYAGGFLGIASNSINISDSYVSSYIYGDVSRVNNHNTALFVAKGSASLTNCAADDNASAANCRVIGDDASVTVDDVVISSDGFYPTKWNDGSYTVYEQAARIAVKFGNSASSMSTASFRGDEVNIYFDGGNYCDDDSCCVGAGTLYSITPTTLTRSNSGIGSVMASYTLDGVTSKRMLMMSLQCWYDNYFIDEVTGKKTYTLQDASDLLEFASLVNNGNDSQIAHSHYNHSQAETGYAGDQFAGAVIKLGDNVDFADLEASMQSIGTASKPFAGTFDGNGNTISNLSISSSLQSCGLFGFLTESAIVTNVHITGTYTYNIESSTLDKVYAGGIIGNYSNGTVTKCSSSANIYITNNLTGYDGTTGNARKLYFGAIAGNVDSGKVLEYCYNMGHIAFASDSGSEGASVSGIAGMNNGTVRYCYNTGIIDGYNNTNVSDYVYKNSVAGVCASNNGTVTQCYNAGILRYAATNSLYAVASGTVTESYADAQYLKFAYTMPTDNVFSSGTMVYLTNDMCRSSTYSEWTQGSTTNPEGWNFTNGYYPQFFYIYNDGVESEIAASKVSALAGMTNLDGSAADARFDTFDSITFNCNGSDIAINYIGAFSTSGNKKLVVTNKGAAMVYVQLGGYTREIYYINQALTSINYMFDFSELTADAAEAVWRADNAVTITDGTGNDIIIPGGVNTFSDTESGTVNLSGTTVRSAYGIGSPGRPYIINTVADLTALSDYISRVQSGGENTYFKLVRDIDCTGVDWTPIGTQSKPFNGTFYGDGHTISNITSQAKKYNGLFGYAGSQSTIEMVAVVNSTFYAQRINDFSDPTDFTGSWTGAITGYTDGLISNCYTKSVVWLRPFTSSPAIEAIGSDNLPAMYAGALTGQLDSNGVIRGCYVRPVSQNGTVIPKDMNAIVSYSSYSNVVCGTLVGKTSGTINGCYHTCKYYEPDGYRITDYGILAGDYAGGSIDNVFYDWNVLDLANKYLFVKQGNTDGVLSGNDMLNIYDATTSEFVRSETSATTNGIANDSMAIRLSSTSYTAYLGTFETNALPYGGTRVNGTAYSNDGYPLLTSFDLSQYNLTSFSTSNLILCMQNYDTSDPQMMNSLCSYGNYDFPTYADIVTKTKLNIYVFSLPDNINYNVSAIAYGQDSGNYQKWTLLNGDYTNSRNLYYNISEEDRGYGHVDLSYIDYTTVPGDSTTHYGATTIQMDNVNTMPTPCDKLYVYITLKRMSTSGNKWGVYSSWDSSSLVSTPEEVEVEGD